ncbi:MAG: LCP family protein [bacterium]
MTIDDQNKKLRNCILLSIFLVAGFYLVYNGFPSLQFNHQNASINSQIENDNSEITEPELNRQTSVLPQTNNKPSQLSIKNILILGRPGENYPGGNLTDTIIIAHLMPENNRAFLISLPRDFLVQIPNSYNSTKINSLYNMIGIEGLKQRVTEITGLSIDRYFIFDLTAAQEIIDLVDGLNVNVPEDIYDPHFPGPGYVYDPFVLKSGWRYLDGRNVLRYVRTRYTSPNGDFDRMARQQQIIRLIKQKVLDLNPLWDFPKYVKIFNTLNENIETDLGIFEMQDIWQFAKNAEAANIATIVIDKKETNLLTSGMIPLGNANASVIWPKAGRYEYEDIKKYIKKYID